MKDVYLPSSTPIVFPVSEEQWSLLREGRLKHPCGNLYEPTTCEDGTKGITCAGKCWEWGYELRRRAEIRVAHGLTSGGTWELSKLTHDERPHTNEVCDVPSFNGDMWVVTDGPLEDPVVDGVFLARAHQDVPWLLDILADLSEVLTTHGELANGRSLKERLCALAARARHVDGPKVRPAAVMLSRERREHIPE